MKRASLLMCFEAGVSVAETAADVCVDTCTVWENGVSTSFVSVLCTVSRTVTLKK